MPGGVSQLFVLPSTGFSNPNPPRCEVVEVEPATAAQPAVVVEGTLGMRQENKLFIPVNTGKLRGHAKLSRALACSATSSCGYSSIFSDLLACAEYARGLEQVWTEIRASITA